MSRLAILIGTTLVCMLPTARGAVTDADLAELRAQIAALTDRVHELEEERGLNVSNGNDNRVAGRPMTRVEEVSAPEARVAIKGDIRYRHESIDEQGRDTRTRQRIRARASLTAAVTDRIEAGLQIASGNDDPVSTNQTLGDGGSTKGVNLDLAYVDWRLPVYGLGVRAGKFRNTLHRAGGTQLIWDGDWNPEGLAAYFDDGPFFGSVTALWAEERSSQSDSLIIGAQMGARLDVGDAKLTIGGGYYDIGNAQGEVPFLDGNPRGNSVDADGNYLFDFEEMEVFVELATDLGHLPLKVHADYIKNLEAGEFDTGFAIGATLGRAGTPGTWQLGYEYRDLERDAVLALFADSDFAGGGTDGKGHILSGAFATGERWNLRATYFINERGGDAGDKRDYDRVQLDANFKY